MMAAIQDFLLDDVSNGESSIFNISKVITASECVSRDMQKELNLGDFTCFRQSDFIENSPKRKVG